MKKRITSLLLALVMCLGLCISAFAAQTENRGNAIEPRTGAVYYSATPFYGTASSYTKQTSTRTASVAAEEFAQQTGYDAMAILIGGIVGGPVGAAITSGFSHFVFSVNTCNVILHAIGDGTIKSSYYVKYTTYDPPTQPSIKDGITYGKVVVQYFLDHSCTEQIGQTETSYRKTVVNMHN